MRFVSTRDSSNQVDFRKAVLSPMPKDGGLYVPDENSDLRKWILYADKNTSFSSLAGSLTSAMINKEFSPIICETIATRAFPKDPVLKQLDSNLFLLELYNGATGTFKDFGVSYLTATLETILQYEGKKAILLDVTTGELGACIAQAIRKNKLVKSVLVAPKGSFRGLCEEDYVWNGGNIYPVEVDGTLDDCFELVQKIFDSPELVEKFSLTVANTANIGRLLPQAFFYTYAFSHIKHLVNGEIYYAVSAGNYGNLVSGLYGWKMSLPLNGFIVPSTKDLVVDVDGKAKLVDSFVPLEKRPRVKASEPSNMERFENIFKANQLLIKSFVYPAKVSEEEINSACKELFVKYKIYADKETSSSYAAYLKRKEEIVSEDGSVVLVARESPCLNADFILSNIGEKIKMTSNVEAAFKKNVIPKDAVASGDIESLIAVLNSVNLL